MVRPVRSDRRWSFEESPDEIWASISEVGNYRRWWPWLRTFDPDDGLVTAACWYCEVEPPLPYVVRFRIELDRVDVARSVQTTVSGDVRGAAELTLRECPDGGTTARLVSRLTPANPLLRTVGTVARPMVQWGHDWVLDQGRRQFVDRRRSST